MTNYMIGYIVIGFILGLVLSFSEGFYSKGKLEAKNIAGVCINAILWPLAIIVILTYMAFDLGKQSSKRGPKR